MIKMLMKAALLASMALLAGCGGGGDDGDPVPPAAGIQPVHCNAAPEQCK
jgi:outer membrane lipopolysaccharide assembly protein LptE/RlpB